MRVFGVGVLAAAIVATACGGGAGAGATGKTGGRVLTVTMSEFRYSPAAISLQAGETVTLVLKNAGTVEHEFMAGRQPTAGRGYTEDWLKAAGASPGGHMGHAGAGVRVAPGASATLTLAVPAEKGELEFGCFVPGHWESGMKGTLAVE